MPLSYFGPSTFSRRLSGEGSSAYVAEDKVAMYVQVGFLLFRPKYVLLEVLTLFFGGSTV